jgi:salicylate hydroxylase
LAIEDGAVLAAMLGRYRDDPPDALRGYEGRRRRRTERVQAMSRKQGRIYGMSGPEALVRNIGMRTLGGERLLAGQDWLYNWHVPETL